MFVGLAGYFSFCFLFTFFNKRNDFSCTKVSGMVYILQETKQYIFVYASPKDYILLECLGTIFYHIDKCVLNLFVR